MVDVFHAGDAGEVGLADQHLFAFRTIADEKIGMRDLKSLDSH